MCYTDVPYRCFIQMCHIDVLYGCAIIMCYADVSAIQGCYTEVPCIWLIQMCHTDVLYRCAIRMCRTDVSIIQKPMSYRFTLYGCACHTYVCHMHNCVLYCMYMYGNAFSTCHYRDIQFTKHTFINIITVSQSHSARI